MNETLTIVMYTLSRIYQNIILPTVFRSKECRKQCIPKLITAFRLKKGCAAENHYFGGTIE